MFYMDKAIFKDTVEIDEINEQIRVLLIRKNFLISERNKEAIDRFDGEMEKYFKRKNVIKGN